MPLTQLAANMREDEMTSAVPIDIKRPDADAVPPGPIFRSPGSDFQEPNADFQYPKADVHIHSPNPDFPYLMSGFSVLIPINPKEITDGPSPWGEQGYTRK
jgi:hypothetical protein